MKKPLVWSALLGMLCLTASMWLVAAGPPASQSSPALASPPEWIKPAFDRGLVSVEFYDPEKQPRE